MYDAMIFGVNKNVSMQLAPAFEINSNINLLKLVDFTDFISCDSYVCHIRKEIVDFEKLIFTDIEDYRNVKSSALWKKS
jgi:hypothetical protein